MPPSYAKRKDVNQNEVVEELLEVLPQCTVHDASGAGDGFPDLVVGYKGRNYLFEVKDGSKPPSSRKLTPAQEKFSIPWQGQYSVCHSAAEICAEILRIEMKHHER